MFEDEKNYITDADIRKQLEFENKAGLLYLIVLFPMVVVFTCLLIGFGSSAIKDINRGFDLESVAKLLIALASIFFIGFCVFHLYNSINNIKKTKNGSFVVVKDKLVRMEERTEYSHSRGHIHTQEIKIFHFRDHGEYRVTAKDGSAFDYSSEEDIFYLVIFDGSISPTLVYNSKIYDYRRG